MCLAYILMDKIIFIDKSPWLIFYFVYVGSNFLQGEIKHFNSFPIEISKQIVFFIQFFIFILRFSCLISSKFLRLRLLLV